MATIAIQVGIAVGGMALQYLFAPKVKQTPVDKGKYDDVRVSTTELGAFIPRGWGIFRIGGLIYFSNGIQHYIIDSPSSGGKGGGGSSAPATRTHVYQTTLGINVCRGAIQEFRRVWADADLIVNNGTVSGQGFFEAEDALLSGGAIAVTDTTASGGEFVANLGNGGKAIFNFASNIVPIDPEDEEPTYLPLTRISFYYRSSSNLQAQILTDGTSMQTVNFTSTDGEWQPKTTVVEGHIETLEYANSDADAPDLDKIGIYHYYVRDNGTHWYQVTGAANPDLAYPSDLDDPSEYYNFVPGKDGGTGQSNLTTTVPSEAVRFYTGTETQTADPALIAYLDARFGAGQGILRASAMRGLAGVVFQDTTLKQGRIANYTFEINAGSATVGAILADLFKDVGIANYNLAAIAGKDQTGFLEFQQTSRRNLIEQLQRYHQFRLAEIGDHVVAVSESADSIATISENDLKAHFDSDSMPEKTAEILLKEEQFMPREIRVSVMQPEMEFHNESVSSEPMHDISGGESKEYTFNIVDSASRARAKANILLNKEHAESKAFEIFGMPKLAKYAPGDVLTLPLGGIVHKFRIEKQSLPLPIGPVRLQAVSVEPEIYALAATSTQNMTRALAKEDFANTTFPRNSVVFVIESIPITGKEKGRLGVYLAISGRGRGSWENCALYREFADGDYRLQSIIDSPSPLGICQTNLETVKSSEDFDEISQADIYFFDDIELENVTPIDIDRYPTLNLVRIGGEWMQFLNAAPLPLPPESPHKSAWRLTNLWRGRFRTDEQMTAHGAGEYAAVVTPALRFYELDRTDIGEEVSFKAVTNGQSVVIAPATNFIFNPLSAYSVTNSTIDRNLDASGATLDEIANVLGTLIGDLNL